jgi:hypothetical protein
MGGHRGRGGFQSLRVAVNGEFAKKLVNSLCFGAFSGSYSSYLKTVDFSYGA